MDDKNKAGIKAAIEKYIQKNDPTANKPKRKNNTPELDFIANELRPYLISQNIDYDVIEAKSTFSEATMTYTSQAVVPGYPDISGNFSNGLAVYIEVKAPGKRRTLRPDQREFLIRKINSNAFASVTDSVEHLDDLIKRFKISKDRKELLLKDLPKPSKKELERDKDIDWDD